jgi:hypothetical protein
MRKLILALVMTAFKRNFSVEEKNLFDLDKHDFPTTICANFINRWILMIDQSTKKGNDHTEFFEVFFRLAILSPSLVKYLLSKDLIRNFFDNFFENQYEKPKNLNLKSIAVDQNFLGVALKEDNKKIVEGQEVMRYKKEKSASIRLGVINISYPSRTYMWKTIEKLIFYCKLSEKPNPWQIELNENYPVSLVQVKLFTNKNYPIDKALLDAKTKGAVRAVSRIYAYASYEDKVLTENLIIIAKTGLKDKQVKDYRIYLSVLKNLWQVRDSLTSYRIEIGLSKFLESASENKKYYQETDIHILFLIKVWETLLK